MLKCQVNLRTPVNRDVSRVGKKQGMVWRMVLMIKLILRAYREACVTVDILPIMERDGKSVRDFCPEIGSFSISPFFGQKYRSFVFYQHQSSRQSLPVSSLPDVVKRNLEGIVLELIFYRIFSV